jgi:hypothetical protein
MSATTNPTAPSSSTSNNSNPINPPINSIISSSSLPNTNITGSGPLSELETRRQQLTESLRLTERAIYDLEDSYIRDTSYYGNVIKGWDGYITVRLNKSSHHSINQAKKMKILNKERLFSNSSITAPRIEEDSSGNTSNIMQLNLSGLENRDNSASLGDMALDNYS